MRTSILNIQQRDFCWGWWQILYLYLWFQLLILASVSSVGLTLMSASPLLPLSPPSPPVSPQHCLTAFGGIIAIPLILSQGLCLQHDSLTQGHLISTIFFVSGMCTLLQVTFGIRWVKLRLVGYGFGQIIQQQQSVCEHKWGQKQGEQGTRESHVYLVNKDWPW